MVDLKALSDANASLTAGLNAFGSGLVNRAAEREAALNRIIAVAPDPRKVDALARLAATGTSVDMIDALTDLAMAGVEPEVIRVAAQMNRRGETNEREKK